jgi:UDP-N-acetylmuramate--alanine ligase
MGLRRQVRRVHFVGIGGIGQSGIAEVLNAQGFEVSGSDMNEGATVGRLRQLGIVITVPHRAEAVDDADVCVVSTAIPKANPEVHRAHERGIPVIRRAEMLGELIRLQTGVCIAGQHGKTTTTTMVADVLTAGGADPTVINGGVLASLGSNARYGKGSYLVCEADESDGSFLSLSPTYALITNLEGADHLETWEAGMPQLQDAFAHFANSVPFYGQVVLCKDDPYLDELIHKITRPVVTYGIESDADFRAVEVVAEAGDMRFSVVARGQRLGEVVLPMAGEHNVLNALGAIALAHGLGVPFSDVQRALAEFAGVGRRFEIAGTFDGVMVVHDYGHHPHEIAAVLEATVRAWPQRPIRAVFQPHRWTRLRDQWDGFCVCFDRAAEVLVSDVYPAGEDAIPSCSPDRFVAATTAHGHRGSRYGGTIAEAAQAVATSAEPGDIVILFGAGDVFRYVDPVIAALSERAG